MVLNGKSEHIFILTLENKIYEMKTFNYNYTRISLILGLILAFATSCERDISDDVVPATFTTNPDVYIDGFSSGLEYYPYADSKHTAFSVDTETKFDGNSSMRFDVPNFGDPSGAYAGAIFRDDNGGRDLSGYDALTFYAKATKAATINSIGFGQDFFGNQHEVSISNLRISTNWEKYTIQIPDASKLLQEKGMFWYAEGPENNDGYTFWIDELKFEKLGTIDQHRPQILGGNDQVVQSFNGGTLNVEGLGLTSNLANGQDQTINVSSSYFEFTSSNPSVANVDANGLVTVLSSGTTVITATLGGQDAAGSLTIESLGDFVFAPTPTQNPANVISIFSDEYDNVPVDFFNGYWEPWQTTESSTISVDNQNVISYTNFNFVGNQFATPTIDATDMSVIHFDVFVPANAVSPQLKITLRDFGNDRADGGNDDSNTTQTFSGATLVPGQWNSLEMSLDGLAAKNNLGLLIYENLGSDLTSFYLDNIYLYKVQLTPDVAAPTPTVDPANVISVFSDAYTDIAGTDFNPNWGQATVVTQESIAGNNTLKLAGLNYQGIQLGSAQDVSGMTHLHIDYYTANSTALNVYLISPGPVETPKALSVPTNSGWVSLEIPLSEFSPVDLMNVIQFKFDGNGEIYFDNIYFHN